MKKQRKNAGEIIINIIVVIILIFTFIMTVNILLSAGKGYIELFGGTAVAVKTDSMNGDKPDSFKRGDLIFVKILEGKEHIQERQSLEKGDIITYVSADVDGDGREDIISHRIISVNKSMTGTVLSYTVKGDHPQAYDTQTISSAAIIGVYTGKAAGLGNFSLFIHTPLGFGVAVVLPSVLIVIYCVYVVIKNFREARGETAGSAITDEQKEKIRQEILAEMAKEKLNDGEPK